MVKVSVELELPPIPIRLKVKTLKVTNKSLEEAYADRRVEVDIGDLDDAAIDLLAQQWREMFRDAARQRRGRHDGLVLQNPTF